MSVRHRYIKNTGGRYWNDGAWVPTAFFAAEYRYAKALAHRTARNLRARVVVIR